MFTYLCFAYTFLYRQQYLLVTNLYISLKLNCVSYRHKGLLQDVENLVEYCLMKLELTIQMCHWASQHSQGPVHQTFLAQAIHSLIMTIYQYINNSWVPGCIQRFVCLEYKLWISCLRMTLVLILSLETQIIDSASNNIQSCPFSYGDWQRLHYHHKTFCMLYTNKLDSAWD